MFPLNRQSFTAQEKDVITEELVDFFKVHGVHAQVGCVLKLDLPVFNCSVTVPLVTVVNGGLVRSLLCLLDQTRLGNLGKLVPGMTHRPSSHSQTNLFLSHEPLIGKAVKF